MQDVLIPFKCNVVPETWNRLGRVILAGIVVLGAWVRLAVAWHMPLQGDEIGTWIYMAYDYRYLFTQFFDPWLSMGPYIAFSKAWAEWFGENPLLLRLPVIGAGVATIPVAAGVVLRLRGSQAMALVTALLMSVNPYLVQFGITLRSYSFLVLFTLLSLYLLLRWLDEPQWKWGIVCGASCAASILSHACSIYFLAFLPAVFLWWRQDALNRRAFTPLIKESTSLLVPVAIGCGLAVAVYIPILGQMAYFKQHWSGPPPVAPHYIPWAMGSYFAPGWRVFPALVLLIAGWIFAVRHHTKLAFMVGAGLAIPVTLYAVSGSAHFPWGSTRFMIFVVPLLLIQVGMATCFITSRRWGRALLVALVLASWQPSLISLYRNGVHSPWSEIAATITPKLREQDVVVVAGNDRLALMPFFKDRQHQLIEPKDYPLDDISDAQNHGLFLVTRSRWQSDQPTIKKGHLSVFLYIGERRSDIAEAFLRDLQRTADGRASPELSVLLRNGLILMERLNYDLGVRNEVQRLYYHSLLQSHSGMYMPLSQRQKRFP